MLKSNKVSQFTKAMKAFYKVSSEGASVRDVEYIARKYGLNVAAFLAHIEYISSDGEIGQEYEVSDVA